MSLTIKDVKERIKTINKKLANSMEQESRTEQIFIRGMMTSLMDLLYWIELEEKKEQGE